jgi:hypothetical protein
MTVRSDIKSLNEAMIPGALEMLVREWANCEEASIDDEGDIWIANPQTGHWLNADDLATFATWTGEQDLDDAQARHNPAWGAAKGIVA